MRLTTSTLFLVIALIANMAFGDFNVMQNNNAPVYPEHSVDFEDAGVPINVATDPFDFYQASDGITFTSGNGFLVASDWDATEFIAGGLNPGIQLNAGFGMRMVFDQPITELSFQGWANGNGPPFGGMNIFLLNDESRAVDPDNAAFASFGGPVPFGGTGPEWFNIVADGGDSFDEVRFFNGAFNSFNTYIDNVSFGAAVPEPSSAGLALMAGVMALFGRRRRR